MIFGEFRCEEAEGVMLAHTINPGERRLKKGHVLTAADVALLRQAGIAAIAGARLEAGDIDESAGAAEIAQLLVGPNTETRHSYNGRCNVHASVRGVFRVDAQAIDSINQLDEAIAIGTLPDYALARRGQAIATVKIIPFAVTRDLIERCRALAAGRPILQLAEIKPRRVALIMGESPETKDVALHAAATRRRLESLGSRLAFALRCSHEPGAYAASLREALAAGCDLLLIAGATGTKDRLDMVPAAVVAAGGKVDHFGMPVEPGNMLLFAHVGPAPVLVLPGCTRSLRSNGLDCVLQRLHAGLPLGRAEIMRMGVGGLIRSTPEPGDPTVIEEYGGTPSVSTGAPQVAALVLAAGRSSRMGATNKLLADYGGVPMALRAVNAALASRAASVTVVLGFDAENMEALLAGRAVAVVRNDEYTEGMSASLRAGLANLPPGTAAVVVLLADMPRVNASHIDCLIEAFDPARPSIVVPQSNGRRGNPILWPREFFAAMQRVRGDTGARELLDLNRERIHTVELDDAIHCDVDTPDDLASFDRIG
ncbi:NTP transferase domain-containing protein [Pollutimonas bauzanensis]|uniref:Molybdenum cofactor cytidylyltransferase n=1 Tax=Pollutimonas bauzanensis TaxID=658167 RepID=A0A1M5QH32_9BURK|nr:molybdopterin-binding/glycosyltransferase family 2 protein [Pollutimonas bauzanensis]SHH13514.1 molybdenum cofactor cytidylyltransferase [Pollutimonas bauzanensis]